jgi:polysaccharide pyruvyl transferase WcaK-like protein
MRPRSASSASLTRRQFVAGTLAAAVPALGAAPAGSTPPKKGILLRSSWQTVNIGDIAHTPGMLRLLEQHLPEYPVTLWPSRVDNGVEEMLMKRFPNLKIAKDKAALKTAFEECAFLLHGSGPGLVAEKSLVQWHKETGKPYGIGGITFAGGQASLDVLSGAKFAFFRDSVSMQYAQTKGCKSPLIALGPDATFAVDLLNDDAAVKFLKANQLEEGQFVCCIPKLRHTPYWKIKPGVPFDEKKHARNEEMRDHDHAPLRAAITAVARETPMKVLLCPEDSSQMAVGKENLYDPLPEDVKKKVVWRETYWLTDEAQSTYNRSAGLFGNEQHSPIMCIGHGIPAIVCRYKEQTSKGFMWQDIGLGEWLFDHDLDEAHKGLVPAVLSIVNDQPAAKAKALKAKAIADARMKGMMDALRKEIEAV